MAIGIGQGAIAGMAGQDSNAAQAPSVVISTDKSRYAPDERINVVIRNESPVTVFVPAATDACSVVGVERLEAATWVGEASCLAARTMQRIEIAPGERLEGMLSPEARSNWVLSHAGFPTSPIPPVAPTAGPGPASPPVGGPSGTRIDPTATVPEGTKPTGPPYPPFHRLTANLPAGTHRISLSYAGAGAKDVVHTAYSDPFVTLAGDSRPPRQ